MGNSVIKTILTQNKASEDDPITEKNTEGTLRLQLK